MRAGRAVMLPCVVDDCHFSDSSFCALVVHHHELQNKVRLQQYTDAPSMLVMTTNGSCSHDLKNSKVPW